MTLNNSAKIVLEKETVTSLQFSVGHVTPSRKKSKIHKQSC